MSIRRTLAALSVLATLLVLAPTGSPADAAPAPAAPAKDPVIVVAGFTVGPLLEPVYWPLVERLKADGYQVDLLTYPDYGIGDIRTQAERLKARVATVKARTGATKVDIVAHSMGGLVSRTYLKDLGGATSVDSLIMLGTPNHGSLYASLNNFLGFGTCFGVVACQQMVQGSAFLNALNAGDDTIGNVRYTAIGTQIDIVVVPYTSVFLDPADGNIANITVQDQCPTRWPEHVSLVWSGAVYDGVRDALRGQPVQLDCWAL